MKDAFGGILNIILIAVFLLIVEGILGLAVSYTKAFKMKNIVISFFEKYEASGNCEEGTECFDKIVAQAQRIGYSAKVDLSCSTDMEHMEKYTNVGGYFCYFKKKSLSGNNWVFMIETQADVDFPIINKIMGMSFFKVRGETRVIRVQE